jgi:hypothetical protein
VAGSVIETNGRVEQPSDLGELGVAHELKVATGCREHGPASAVQRIEELIGLLEGVA